MVSAADRSSPPAPRRILVADDDGHIREVLKFALERAGYHVTLSADGLQALSAFEKDNSYSLVVLDILMPGLDGLELCRKIRETSNIPLVFVSSQDEELDRIVGLELGADDYITKPFSPRELVARVKATLRRYDDVLARTQDASRKDPEPPALHWGPLTLDTHRHRCSVSKEEVVLTVSEFSLLEALLKHRGQVLSRAQLVQVAYGPGHFLSDRTVDSHIRRIRSKLKKAGVECIETVYGLGYRLSEGSA